MAIWQGENSKYFAYSEFMCECGCGCCRMDSEFIYKLNELRERCGFAFIINSGYRCTDWNEYCGGAVNSGHCLGLAADIKCIEDRKRGIIIKNAIDLGFKRLGISSRFVHLDLKPTEQEMTIWTYGK